MRARASLNLTWWEKYMASNPIDGGQPHRTIDELVAIAFANILDYVDVTPQGMTVKDLSRLTPAQRIAVAEASETHIKLHDKVAALSELARRLGMYGKLTSGW